MRNLHLKAALRPALVALAAGLLALAGTGGQALAHGEETHTAAQPEAADAPPVGGGPTNGMPAEAASAAPRETAPAVGQAEAEHEGGASAVLRNLHPALVHFPIALLLAAALTELLGAVRPSPGLRHATQAMVVGGAAGAVVAVVSGWVHTGLWLGGDETMQLHRWIGTGLAPVGVALAGVALQAGDSRTLLRAGLALVAAAVLVQGYLGGELAHGAGHLFAAH